MLPARPRAAALPVRAPPRPAVSGTAPHRAARPTPSRLASVVPSQNEYNAERVAYFTKSQIPLGVDAQLVIPSAPGKESVHRVQLSAFESVLTPPGKAQFFPSSGSYPHDLILWAQGGRQLFSSPIPFTLQMEPVLKGLQDAYRCAHPYHREYHRGVRFLTAGPAGLFRHVEKSYATGPVGAGGSLRHLTEAQVEAGVVPPHKIKSFPYYEFYAGKFEAMHAYIKALDPFVLAADEAYARVEPHLEEAQRLLIQAFHRKCPGFSTAILRTWSNLAIWEATCQANSDVSKPLGLVLHVDGMDARLSAVSSDLCRTLGIDHGLLKRACASASVDAGGDSAKRRQAAITCSFALVLGADADGGELKIFVGWDATVQAPIPSSMPDCLIALDQGQALVSTLPNNRFNFFHAADVRRQLPCRHSASLPLSLPRTLTPSTAAVVCSTSPLRLTPAVGSCPTG